MMVDKKITTEDADKAEFVYQEVKEYLLHTVDNIKSLRNKATLLVGFLLSVVAFAIPTLFSAQKDIYVMEFKAFLLAITLIYTIILLLLVYYVILPNTHEVTGNEIDNLDAVYDKPTFIIKLVEADEFQRRININIKIYQRIDRFLQYSLYMTAISPIIVFLALLIIDSFICMYIPIF